MKFFNMSRNLSLMLKRSKRFKFKEVTSPNKRHTEGRLIITACELTQQRYYMRKVDLQEKHI